MRRLFVIAVFLTLLFAVSVCEVALGGSRIDSFVQRMHDIRMRVSSSMKSACKDLVNPRECIKLREKVIINNPYKNSIASVRFGNVLCDEEQQYRIKRKEKVQKALECCLGRTLHNTYVPTISVVCSGGGYRAMFGTLGCFSGMERIGIFDATTYISTLSGSTWALGILMATGMSLSECKRYIAKNSIMDIKELASGDAQLMAHAFAVKFAFKQPCTLVDLFGGLLANRLLSYYGDERHMIHLSDQVERVKNGEYPYPIYTAIDGRRSVIGDAPWYEFTPYEIGAADFAAYVPSWAYGRYFWNGKSIDDAPEQSLGFYFGVFGSAFGAHVGLMWERLIWQLPPSFVRSAIEKIVINPLNERRFFWASIPNYLHGVQGHVLRDKKMLKVLDAGIESNLPYPPVSGQRQERKPDILLFFDFFETGWENALSKCERYAHKHSLKFPKVNYDGIRDRMISIFKDESDPSVPVVIYMPRLSDKNVWQEKRKNSEFTRYYRISGFDIDQCTREGFCHTLNFEYNMHQSYQLMDQMEFNVVVNKDKILDEIRWVIDKKS